LKGGTVTESRMSEEWVEKIADAVVRRLDEREQINAIAMEVLRILDARAGAMRADRGSLQESVTENQNTGEELQEKRKERQDV